MKRLFFSCYIIFFFCLSAFTASAQRTSDGVFLIDLSPAVSVYSIPSGGVEAAVGQYMFNSYWKAAVSAVNWNTRAGSSDGSLKGVVFDHTHWKAKGGWMYRLWGTYDRMLSIYAGGCAFLGMNSYYTFRRLPQEIDPGYPNEFIYGIEPEVCLEVFVGKRIALTAGIQSPFTFSSSLRNDLWHLTATIGIRFNL